MKRMLKSWLVVPALIIGLFAVVGCGNDKAAPENHGAHEAGHDHPSEGPHKGQLIELGNEEYHAELLHDDAAHKITIYLLDGSAKKAIPIVERDVVVNLFIAGKPSQIKIPAVPQEGDPSGTSSRFELVDEPLCEALDDPKSKGRLNLTIAGKQYSGEMAHDEHDHHK